MPETAQYLPVAPVAARRVLMVCYYYPPINSSGTARAARFATHLPAVGWAPTVLSVSRPKDTWGVIDMQSEVPADVPVVRVPELNLNRAVDLLDGAMNRITGRRRLHARETICIPDPQIGWSAWGRGVALARRHDCIYVSCSPFSSAVTGAWLKAITGTPLVLDFRDAWTLNPYNRHTRFHQAAIQRLERHAIASCDRLILNTPGAMTRYQAAYPEFAAKMCVIPNGFERLNVADRAPRPQRFTVMHVGTLYGNREPRLLLDALASLPECDAEFVQVGPQLKAFDNYRDHVRIRTLGAVPRERALELMRGASLLYLKQGWTDSTDNNIAIAAKTYDYLATGLPILAECPPGDNADVVRRSARHSYLVLEPSLAAMRAALAEAYRRRNERPEVTTSFAREFSPEHLTARLGAELTRAAAPHNARRPDS